MSPEFLYSAGAILVVVLVAWKAMSVADSGPTKQKPKAKAAWTSKKPLKTKSRADGLKTEIFVEGSGPKAENGCTLTVHYIGRLKDGTKVDSSYDRGKPYSFKLGRGDVIYGWDQGLLGVQEGEKRIITVPAKLAYGSKGTKSVPKNADILFEIELIKLSPKGS